MVQTASLFSQLLHEVPRNEFARLVHTHQGERHGQRVHLLGAVHRHAVLSAGSCRLAPSDLQRPRLLRGEAGASGHHPGTEHVQPVLRQRASARCALRGPVLDDDAPIPCPEPARRARTPVPFQETNCSRSIRPPSVLCLSLFPWATFRRAKGGVKAHVLLDHDDYLPAYVLISQARMPDAKVLGLLRLNAGSIVAMDRAYNDYRQFARWTDAGVYFVHAHEGQRRLRRR